MCHHAKVTRTQLNGDGNLEFMKEDGAWTKDPSEAHKVSEEDAKAFARTLGRFARGEVAEYTFDFTTVDD